MDQDVPTDECAVTVCICTFRRASIIATIRSVVNQTLPDGLSCQIIVIDNDFTPTGASLVAKFCPAQELSWKYVHAPGQNISVARNAALDTCRTRWLAFVDDDETAAPNWLSRLVAGRAGAAAVFGPSEAIYDEQTPRWIRIGDYHSNRVVRRNGLIETGYTSNVLIDMDFIRTHRLRFDEEFGRTGGEDTIFFHAVHRCGGHLAYAADAVVYESVSPARTTLRWIATRRYRTGQTYAKLQQRYDHRKYRQLPFLSPFKIAFCIGIAGLLAICPSRGMWWLMRGAFHLGTLSYRINAKVYEEYYASIQKDKR